MRYSGGVFKPLWVLPALALALPGCRFRVHEHSSYVTDYGLVHAKTGVKRSEFEVTPKMERIQVELSADARSGAAEWTLVDPDGATIWRNRLDGAGRVEETVQLRPKPGTWSFRRELDDFTGRHDLRLSAEGGMRLDVTVTPAPAD